MSASYDLKCYTLLLIFSFDFYLLQNCTGGKEDFCGNTGYSFLCFSPRVFRALSSRNSMDLFRRYCVWVLFCEAAPSFWALWAFDLASLSMVGCEDFRAIEPAPVWLGGRPLEALLILKNSVPVLACILVWECVPFAFFSIGIGLYGFGDYLSCLSLTPKVRWLCTLLRSENLLCAATSAGLFIFTFNLL